MVDLANWDEAGQLPSEQQRLALTKLLKDLSATDMKDVETMKYFQTMDVDAEMKAGNIGVQRNLGGLRIRKIGANSALGKALNT